MTVRDSPRLSTSWDPSWSRTSTYTMAVNVRPALHGKRGRGIATLLSARLVRSKDYARGRCPAPRPLDTWPHGREQRSAPQIGRLWEPWERGVSLTMREKASGAR